MTPEIAPGIDINEHIMSSMIIRKCPKVHPELLPTKIRNREYVVCRMLLSCFKRMKFNKTLEELGMPIRRDHASILHYFRLFRNLYEADKKTAELIDELKAACLITDNQFYDFINDNNSYLIPKAR